MNDLEKYIEHCAGLYGLLAWLESEVKNGFSYQISNQIIYLDPLISRYFSLGISQSKKIKKKFFIAIQPIESKWFYLIKWNNIVLRNGDNYMYFVANTVFGDQNEYPDIPGFAIGLYIDTKEKRELLVRVNKIIGREYFQDDTGWINVNHHKILFELPVFYYEKNQKIVSAEDITDYSHLLAQKEQSLQSIYTEMPEFLGDIANIKGSEELMKKWRNNQI